MHVQYERETNYKFLIKIENYDLSVRSVDRHVEPLSRFRHVGFDKFSPMRATNKGLIYFVGDKNTEDPTIC